MSTNFLICFEHYSEEELLTLLSLTRSDVIYPAIILAGCLRLRRSEALGARWSRINWDDNTILLDTKVMEYDEDGKTMIEPIEEMRENEIRRQKRAAKREKGNEK